MQLVFVLLDVQMPKMDGYAATSEIRRLEGIKALAPTPIFTLTAHALKDDEKKSLEAGCNGHLTKPIKKTVLLDVLNSLQK
jgi:CheY-like chemotaxis protein